MSLEKGSRAQVLVGIPPVAGARGGTASAQDALIHAIKLQPILFGLKILLAVGRRLLRLQPGFNALVLRVELRHVHHQVLNDVHVRQRRNDGLRRLRLNGSQAREPVAAADVHGARAAYALAARPPEREARVDLVLDFDERVQHHGPALVRVDGVCL